MTDPKQVAAQKIEAELFNTKEKKQRAIADLQALLANPGWIILEKILKFNAEANATVLLDEEGLTKEQENELRKDRLRFMFLKILPQKLIEQFTAQVNYVEPNDDPYEPNNDPTLDSSE